jgi:carboxyl-terminal processing protease
MKGPHVRKKTLGPILLVVLFAAVLVQLPIAIAQKASDYAWFDPIIDVHGVLTDQYVEAPDGPAMQKAMIDGMIATLKDPFTIYVPPSEEREFNKELRGEYVGIGAEVDIADEFLTIITPMDDSPALEAGVLAGDVVLEIEGQSTHQVPVDKCIEMLLGEEGTPVNIRVRHADGEEQTLTIIRRQIVTHTVKGIRRDGAAWDYCIDGELGLSYVRVTQFNANTMAELQAALAAMQSSGLNGLILDLRDNPGGALNSALEMADLFLEEGTIVSIRGRSGDGRAWQAQRPGTLPAFPMVVLVNSNSASASEIVAGALRDNGRAKILGERTYGKGSVQDVRELPDRRGTLKFTSAYYYLPSGTSIHRRPNESAWGVDPDPGFAVSLNNEQYVTMIRTRREHEAIRNGGRSSPGPCNDRNWVQEHLEDPQLEAALIALRAHVGGAPWPKVGEENTSLAALDHELEQESQRRVRLLELLTTTEKKIGELQKLTTAAGGEPLLPPDVDLRDGTLTVRDKFGNVIGAYRIEGGNVELALTGIALRPVAKEE